MSCERLRGEIDQKRGALREGSSERRWLVTNKLVLLECCPANRSSLTHTANILSAERNALADENWQSAKAEVEKMLNKIDNNS